MNKTLDQQRLDTEKLNMLENLTPEDFSILEYIYTTRKINHLIQEIKQRDDISNNVSRFAVEQLEELKKRL